MNRVVIYIDRSIDIVMSTRNLSREEAVFFSGLANMFFHGDCFLCGDIRSLDKMSHKLGEPYDDIYNIVKGQYSENRAVISAVDTMIVLLYEESFQEDNLPDIVMSCDNIHRVPVPVAMSWHLENRVNLIAENLEDCEFYEAIASYYCAKHSIRGFRASLHHENGGGNTINSVLRECVAKDRSLSLCIVDSDKKWEPTKQYPNPPPLGDTYYKVKQESDDLNHHQDYPKHCLYLLDVHEVENLIPRSVLRKIQTNQQLPDMKAGLDILDALIEINKSNAVLCYDIKKGLPYTVSEPQRSFWREIMMLLGGSEEDMPPCSKPKKTDDNKTPLFFPPVSNNNLLRRATCILHELELSELQLDDYLVDSWEHVGKMLFSWGCAGFPISG